MVRKMVSYSQQVNTACGFINLQVSSSFHSFYSWMYMLSSISMFDCDLKQLCSSFAEYNLLAALDGFCTFVKREKIYLYLQSVCGFQLNFITQKPSKSGTFKLNDPNNCGFICLGFFRVWTYVILCAKFVNIHIYICVCGLSLVHEKVISNRKVFSRKFQRKKKQVEHAERVWDAYANGQSEMKLLCYTWKWNHQNKNCRDAERKLF